jgi:hypothetical protein
MQSGAAGFHEAGPGCKDVRFRAGQGAVWGAAARLGAGNPNRRKDVRV